MIPPFFFDYHCRRSDALCQIFLNQFDGFSTCGSSLDLPLSAERFMEDVPAQPISLVCSGSATTLFDFHAVSLHLIHLIYPYTATNPPRYQGIIKMEGCRLKSAILTDFGIYGITLS